MNNMCKGDCGCNCSCLLTLPFRIVGNAFVNFCENTALIHMAEEGKRLRAKKTEAETKRIYAGTRVVEVAHKIYKHWRWNKENFWFLSNDIRNPYLKMAKEQLLANPRCWNIFAIIKGKIINPPLHLTANCIGQINKRSKLSHEWHCRLYHWDVVLDRNWCAVSYQKIQAAKALSVA